MKALTISTAIIALIPHLELRAQAANGIPYGERIRLTAPGCDLPQRTGILRGVSEDSVHFQMADAELSCPISDVSRLEVFKGRSRWTRGATTGALIGSAVGAVALGLLGDMDRYGTFDPRTAALGLVGGGLIGAGFGKGPRARKWMLWGAGLSAGAGIAIGGSCKDMGCLLVLFVVPVPLGVASIGALLQRDEEWADLSIPAVRPSVYITPEGNLGLGVSLPVGR